MLKKTEKLECRFSPSRQSNCRGDAQIYPKEDFYKSWPNAKSSLVSDPQYIVLVVRTHLIFSVQNKKPIILYLLITVLSLVNWLPTLFDCLA